MGGGDPEQSGAELVAGVLAREAEVAVALSTYRRELLLYIDSAGRIVAADGQLTTALGYELGDHEGSHIAEHIHPDDLQSVLDVVAWARTTEPPFHHVITARARHRDGSWVPFRSEVLSAEPPLLGVVVRCRPLDSDDSEFVQGDSRFASLADVVPAGILTADVRGFVVFSNDAASQLLGVPPDDLHGNGWERHVAADDRDDLASAAQRVLAGGGHERLVVRVARLAEDRWLHVTLVGLGTEARRSGWLATLEDVTERHEVVTDLAHKATHDPLTGLPNRVLLEDRLGQAVARQQRDGRSVAVLFFDLERFKEINDSLGHAAGDAVLVEVARRLQDHLREVDTLVRLGGDEFVVVCEGLDASEIQPLAERLRSIVAEPIDLDGADHRQGISVGVAVGSSSASPADLLARADQAMYRDKRDRRLRA